MHYYIYITEILMLCKRRRKMKKNNLKLKAVTVLNMVKKGTTLTSDIIKQLESFDIQILKSQISDRVNFTRSVALDNAIYGIGDHKAEKEIDNLTKEILMMLNV